MSKDCAEPNVGNKICGTCRVKQQLTLPSWKCFHHEMSNEQQLRKYEEALEDLKSEWTSDIEEVKKHGKLKLVGLQFKHSIDYEPSNIEESMTFVQVLANEMRIRNLATAGKSVAQMREEVKSHLTAEAEMDELIQFIGEESTRSEVMSRILRYVPCILHCENRCGIKIFETLLMEGLSNAQGELLPDHSDDTIGKRETTYIASVETHLNTSALGSEGNIAQYQVPLEKKKGQATKNIGVVNMENYRMRNVIDELDHIIDISVVDGHPGEERRKKWLQCLKHYRLFMKILRKKGSNYTQQELTSFQYHLDHFFQLWVELHGRQGVTNYLHMVGSGHMLEYMIRWGNLTKYSQQGWEALNALIKLFFFRRTNKGGGRGEVKSKLIAIGNLMQRRLFWICNLVPIDLWDKDFNIDDAQIDYENIIFDCESLVDSVSDETS